MTSMLRTCCGWGLEGRGGSEERSERGGRLDGYSERSGRRCDEANDRLLMVVVVVAVVAGGLALFPSPMHHADEDAKAEEHHREPLLVVPNKEDIGRVRFLRVLYCCHQPEPARALAVLDRIWIDKADTMVMSYLISYIIYIRIIWIMDLAVAKNTYRRMYMQLKWCMFAQHYDAYTTWR